MSPTGRWVVVAALAATVLGAPALGAAWPAQDRDVSASELLDRVRGAEGRGWSGYVETRGTLSLPSVDRFDSVSALLGEETRLRAWWRDEETWRVDRLFTAGESDLLRRGDSITEWSYERARANVSRDPEIRLPRASDLLPPELGARVVQGLGPDAASRLPAQRVAGREALGLRLRPGPQSSVTQADLWVDPGTGIPLLVEIYAAGDREPSFRTGFGSFDDAIPSAEAVSFTLPEDAEGTFDDVLDIADAANQYAPLAPPATVAGLARADSSDGAVGVYGEGLVQLIAIPLRDREAEPLREQLLRIGGNEQTDTGTVAQVGPLGVLLTGEVEGGWLLAGTVTRATLEEASSDVLDDAVYVAGP